MKLWEKILVCVAVALSAPAAIAQDSERAQSESDRERAIVERERAERETEQAAEREAVDIEVEMREAESRMAEAARRIAELSSRQLPNLSRGYWNGAVSGKPVLGITIGAGEDAGPVEGVEVVGVSPGGAAGEAGLRAGDVITAVNDEALSADSSNAANRKLLEFMSGVEAGDVIDVEYLRAAKSGSVEVAPQAMSPRTFSFVGPRGSRVFPAPPVAPGAPRAAGSRFVFVSGEQGWGDMEMVKLTEGLGRYFGTDEGLLVVRAPKDEAYELQDGDVIIDIDGRTPNSVSHAIRILGSYQEGESLEIRIMRDKRARTLEIEMPQAKRQQSRREIVIGSTAPRIAPDVRGKVNVRAADPLP